MEITINELIKKMREELEKNNNVPNTIFMKCQELVIKKNNPEHALALALSRLPGLDIQALGQVVINSKNPKLNLEFAKRVKNADIKAHAKVILDSQISKANFEFAKEVKGADIKAHEQVVLDSKDPEINFMFVKEIKNADIAAHQKVILESRNPKENARFIYLITTSNTNKDIDLEPHIKVVLDSKDPEWNYFIVVHSLMLDSTKKLITDYTPFTKVILESKDPIWNLKYAKLKNIYNLDIDLKKHEQVIIDSKDPKANYEFAMSFPNEADIISHWHVIKNCGEKYYVTKFKARFSSKIDSIDKLDEERTFEESLLNDNIDLK